MNIVESLLCVLTAKMSTPKPYGWFHLLSWGVVVAATVYLCVFQRDASPARVNAIIFYISLTTFVLEIYRQLCFSLSICDNRIIFEYKWFAFPWQFCSIPMYAGMLSGIIKKGKIHDALYNFLGSYAVFAGFCVMFSPNDVFTELIGINIQTMFCHGTMIVLGVWLLASNNIKLEHKSMLKAFWVFIFVLIVAMILNEFAHVSRLLEKHTFNMFFISPYCTPSLRVYSYVQNAIAYPWCVFLYVIVFSFAAYSILLAAMLIKKCLTRKLRISG